MVLHLQSQGLEEGDEHPPTLFWGNLPICLSIYLSVCLRTDGRTDVYIYLKSQDYGDVSAGAQQGRLTMS